MIAWAHAHLWWAVFLLWFSASSLTVNGVVVWRGPLNHLLDWLLRSGK